MRALAAIVTTIALVAPMHAQIIEQVLVKVNGDIITKSDLESRQIAALRDRGNVDAAALKNDNELKKALAEVTPQVLVNAIDELLLLQLGRERGYSLRDEDFQRWLTDLRKQQNLVEDGKFQEALKQEGMTLDDLRRNLEKSVIVQQVQRAEVGSKLQITEEEARQYYLAHKDDFVEPATVTLREIFIEIPSATQGGQAGVNVAQQDAAKAEADAAYKRVTSGEDFGKVAAEVSDSASKANGGLIGPLALSELSDGLRKQLEAMKSGDVMAPNAVGKGYQILKLETMKTAAAQPFESVRDVVADKVYETRQREEVRKFLSRIRSQAIIEWKNPDLKKMYDARVAAAASASNE